MSDPIKWKGAFCCKQADCLASTIASDGFCSAACRTIEALRRERDSKEKECQALEHNLIMFDKMLKNADRERDENWALAEARTHELGEALLLADALKAKLQRAREALVVVVNSSMAFHDHWDNTMQHGVGCPTCIEQRAVREVVRKALADLEGGDDGHQTLP